MEAGSFKLHLRSNIRIAAWELKRKLVSLSFIRLARVKLLPLNAATNKDTVPGAPSIVPNQDNMLSPSGKADIPGFLLIYNIVNDKSRKWIVMRTINCISSVWRCLVTECPSTLPAAASPFCFCAEGMDAMLIVN